MKTIFITNDDGIHSPGLKALHQALQTIATTVVIAPDRDNSAVSHSLTMNRPLRVKEVDKGWYTVDGTPTDCVALGLKTILDTPPDLLVSGINHGPNLGDDISYSGTVSAAIEGTIYGIPSLAISVGGTQPLNFNAAKKIAVTLAEKALSTSLPPHTLLNINVPSGEQPDAMRITRKGRRIWQDSIQKTLDPRGNTLYWIGGGTAEIDSDTDTDVNTFFAGKVSITPIQLDVTNHQGISFLAANWQLE